MSKDKIVSSLKLILYFLLTFVFQQAIHFIFPGLNLYPDFLFVLAWTFAYFYNWEWYLPYAIFLGLIRDVFYTPIFGLSIFLSLMGAFLASSFLRFIWQRRYVFLPIQIAFVSLVVKLTEGFLMDVFDFLKFEQPILFGQMMKAFYNQLVITIFFNILASIFIYLLIVRIIPFIKKGKDVYAENLLVFQNRNAR